MASCGSTRGRRRGQSANRLGTGGREPERSAPGGDPERNRHGSRARPPGLWAAWSQASGTHLSATGTSDRAPWMNPCSTLGPDRSGARIRVRRDRRADPPPIDVRAMHFGASVGSGSSSPPNPRSAWEVANRSLGEATWPPVRRIPPRSLGEADGCGCFGCSDLGIWPPPARWPGGCRLTSDTGVGSDGLWLPIDLWIAGHLATGPGRMAVGCRLTSRLRVIWQLPGRKAGRMACWLPIDPGLRVIWQLLGRSGSRATPGRGSARQGPADHQPLDLVGALDDLQHLRSRM